MKVLLFSAILAVTLHAQGRGGGTAQAPGRIPPIEERVNGMQKLDGYFPLYWDDRTGSLFMEISRFHDDFLLANGLAAGLGIAAILVEVVNPQSFHWTMELRVPFGRLLALSASLLLAAALTSILAGRRALSIDAVRAVKDDW